MQTYWIDKTLVQTLDSIFQYFPTPLQGYLIGFVHQQQTHILNAVRNVASFENIHQLHSNMLLPCPLQIVGHFYSVDSSSEKNKFLNKSNICIGFVKQTKTKTIFVKGETATLQETDCKKYFSDHFSLFRIQQQIFISSASLSEDTFWNQTILENLKLGESVSLPLQPFASNIATTDIPNNSIGEFLQQNKGNELQFKPRIPIPPLHYTPLFFQQQQTATNPIELELDIFFYTCNKEDWKLAAQHSLRNVSQLMIQTTSSKTIKLGSYSFLPLQSTQLYPHLLTIIYSFVESLSLTNTREEESDPRLSKIRNEIHDILFFAKQIPFFKVTNALPISVTTEIESNQTLPILSNLHWYCTRKSTISMPTKFTFHSIKHHYYFYHYCMDQVNDNGWGCAYRSLQTVISFVKQLYIACYRIVTIPTHLQMQRTLVLLGDKAKEFVNSKEWIGMIECGLLLDFYCGMGSKIINFNQSKDNVSVLSREFCKHFDEQGTPIMIGGGVLALTCLGIDFDSTTNEVSFLILDPHYICSGGKSRSDVKLYLQDALQRKAISWKTANQLFLPQHFYNCLFPLLPKIC